MSEVARSRGRGPLVGLAMGCLVVAALGALLGAAAAFLGGYAWLSGAFEPWETVPTPAGHTVSRLLPSNTLTLVVETEDGSIFARHATGWDWSSHDRADTSWQRLEEATPRSEQQAEWASCREADGSEWGSWSLRMPREALDHIYCESGRPEVSKMTHFILIPSGEIRSWWWSSGGLGGAIYLGVLTLRGSLLGALIALAIGLSVWVVNRRRSRV